MYPAILQDRFNSAVRFFEKIGGTRTAIALASSACALTVFFLVADQVREQDHHTTVMDRAVSMWMHAHELNSVTTVALAMAALGSVTMMVIVGIVSFIVACLWPQLRAGAISVPISILGAFGVIEGIKFISHRARPTFFIPLLKTSGYSFPSGHAVIAVTLYGMLGYILLLHLQHKQGRVAVILFTVLLICAIGISRIYVGVHYTTDVIAGWSIAIPWLFICITIHDWIARRIPAADKPIPQVLDTASTGSNSAKSRGSMSSRSRSGNNRTPA